MFDFRPKFASISALLESDAREALPDDDFGDQLWLLLCERIRDPADLRGLPSEVSVYFGSRYLQWEIGNGGFAQAAANVPEWFGPAEDGYAALGKTKMVEVIRKARALFSEDEDELAAHEDDFDRLDSELPDGEWEIDAERVRFVRAHRAAFESVHGARRARARERL